MPNLKVTIQRVMKAEPYVDGMVLPFPMLASPKLDGIRAIVMGTTVLSAKLKPIPNKHVQRLLGRLDNHGKDGELIVGPHFGEGVFKRTSSGVMSVEGTPDVHFFVFDTFALDAPYRDRLKAVMSPAAKMCAGIVPLGHDLIRNLADLKAYEEWAIKTGYEGVILRHPEGPYKQGRATAKEGWLFKVKRFVDDEAIIVGMVEQMHNGNEAQMDERGLTKRSSAKAGKSGMATMGALIVKSPKWKKPFEIGTGFSADERAEFWKMGDKAKGLQVKFKYFAYGVDEAPRHPSYLGIRSEID